MRLISFALFFAGSLFAQCSGPCVYMTVGSHQFAQVHWLDANGVPAQVDGATTWTTEPPIVPPEPGILGLAPWGRVHGHQDPNDPGCRDYPGPKPHTCYPNTDGHGDGGDSTKISIDAHKPGHVKLIATATAGGQPVKSEIEVLVLAAATRGEISAITNPQPGRTQAIVDMPPNVYSDTDIGVNPTIAQAIQHASTITVTCVSCSALPVQPRGNQ